jgi:hypothetical protein
MPGPSAAPAAFHLASVLKTNNDIVVGSGTIREFSDRPVSWNCQTWSPFLTRHDASLVSSTYGGPGKKSDWLLWQVKLQSSPRDKVGGAPIPPPPSWP